VISDFRGLEKIVEVPSAPALYGCLQCWLRGFRVCRKTTYCGHHTQLPADHPLRETIAEITANKVAATPTPNVTTPTDANSTEVPTRRLTKQHRAGMIIYVFVPWFTIYRCSASVQDAVHQSHIHLAVVIQLRSSVGYFGMYAYAPHEAGTLRIR
jgi:hypothetical protein